jgi:DnaD/phage-associated family protein
VRSNVFVLYEQNIGPLTPLIADELRDAMAHFPAQWIEDAIRVAVRNNIRKLKYIQAVLDRMKSEGRVEQPQENAGQDLSRYDGYLAGDSDAD